MCSLKEQFLKRGVFWYYDPTQRLLSNSEALFSLIGSVVLRGSPLSFHVYGKIICNFALKISRK